MRKLSSAIGKNKVGSIPQTVHKSDLQLELIVKSKIIKIKDDIGVKILSSWSGARLKKDAFDYIKT